MPWLRYFVFIGGTLLALLFVADAFSTKETVAVAQAGDAEKPMLRIRSDVKWPERIVIDTTQPTITPPPAAPVTAMAPVPKAVANIDTTTAPLEAYAQVRPVESKKPQPQVQKRKVAKVERHPSMASVHQNRSMASAQQNPFDFFVWR